MAGCASARPRFHDHWSSVKMDDQIRVLTEWNARQVLAGSGVPFATCLLARDHEEAVSAAESIGYPVVVKVHAPALVHKTEAGGVQLDVRDAEGVRRACRAIRNSVSRIGPAGQVEGFLVQPLVGEGIDLFLGIARDAGFGPYLLLGLGGIWVEVLDDVVAVVLPATVEDVLEAVQQLRAYPLLAGSRGRAPVDCRAVANVAIALGQHAMRHRDAYEIDLNPVRAFAEGSGALALDARIVLRPAGGSLRPSPSAEAVRALVQPEGVVVVGVSKNAAKFGSRVVRSMLSHGYDRPLWALHPRDREVQGIPAYPSVSQSPFKADLAFITLEGQQVQAAVREVAQAGVRAAVVFASGFGESGPEGQARQDALIAAARGMGVAILGPNTPGLVSQPAKLYGSFVGTMSMRPEPDGDIVLLTQSGSIGSALMGRGWDRGLAFRAWIATGDEADISIEHLLDHYAGDPGTRVVAMFIESIRDGARFRSAARRARAEGKRLVVYAIGRSETAQAAIQSHTGSLGGNQRLYDAVFRQDGIARVCDLDEMLDAIQALDWCETSIGPRVAVVSSSGASCGIAADDCEANGLVLPPLSDGSRRRLAEILPAFAGMNNPLDVTAEVVTNPDLMGQALATVASQGDYDAMLVTLGTQQGPAALQVAQAIVDLRERISQPIVISRLGADSLNPEMLAFYRQRRMPVYSSPTRAARALRHLVQQGRR